MICLSTQHFRKQRKGKKGTVGKKKKGAKYTFVYCQSIIVPHRATVLKLVELIRVLSLLCLSYRKCSSHKAVGFQRKFIF